MRASRGIRSAKPATPTASGVCGDTAGSLPVDIASTVRALVISPRRQFAHISIFQTFLHRKSSGISKWAQAGELVGAQTPILPQIGQGLEDEAPHRIPGVQHQADLGPLQSQHQDPAPRSPRGLVQRPVLRQGKEVTEVTRAAAVRRARD